MRLIGYARVSTVDQQCRLQRDALKRSGARKVYEEKASAVSVRPVLQQALGAMKPGDVLVVWKLDRLARSVRDLLGLIERLDRMGCGLRSLTEPIDTSSALGEFVLQMLGAVAQFERSLIRERVIAGQVAAIQRGERHGRPALLSDEDQADIARLYRAGGVSMQELADRYRVGRWVVQRVVSLDANPSHPKYSQRRPVLGPLLVAAK